MSLRIIIFDGINADLATFDTSIDSLAMVEGKAGFANEKMALYGKAGVAVGKVVTGLVVDGSSPDGDWALEDGSEDFIAGLTVGAAGEAMLTDNISAFLSYNAIFYGDQSYRGHSDIDQQQAAGGEGAISSWDTTAIEHLIRFGMNYHFGAETSGSDLSLIVWVRPTVSFRLMVFTLECIRVFRMLPPTPIYFHNLIPGVVTVI